MLNMPISPANAQALAIEQATHKCSHSNGVEFGRAIERQGAGHNCAQDKPSNGAISEILSIFIALSRYCASCDQLNGNAGNFKSSSEAVAAAAGFSMRATRKRTGERKWCSAALAAPTFATKQTHQRTPYNKAIPDSDLEIFCDRTGRSANR